MARAPTLSTAELAILRSLTGGTGGDDPLPEDAEIEATPPVNRERALRMIAAKRTPAGLVALLNWLLTVIDNHNDAIGQAQQADAEAQRLGELAEARGAQISILLASFAALRERLAVERDLLVAKNVPGLAVARTQDIAEIDAVMNGAPAP